MHLILFALAALLALPVHALAAGPNIPPPWPGLPSIGFPTPVVGPPLVQPSSVVLEDSLGTVIGTVVGSTIGIVPVGGITPPFRLRFVPQWPWGR
jgi:hypothetical protein